MKKTILMTALVLMVLSAGLYYHYMRQPQNIFDEMYQETKKSYKNKNIFSSLNGVDVRKYQEYDDSHFYSDIVYSNKYLPDTYKNVELIFHFTQDTRTVFLSFEKELAPDIRIWIFGRYSLKEKRFRKSVQIIKQGDPDKYIDKASQVKKYLADYGITAADLDRYYDEIINQKVLTDWCAIYDSNYSPADYGHVKVVTEWEKW
ncbi:TipC family immunity protein [Streptococcus pantholopis]|uniref:TipC family immunity protein n=1 Tax=Streptococcus pantholopis TaxID=1811193 RepID=A0A172Q807_9STRE|nr:TipC family immunity protein [Streptococcus pantholopis]AND79596.1 hypothetical protein A0O21_05940 [Streptococcus pantholopis]